MKEDRGNSDTQRDKFLYFAPLGRYMVKQRSQILILVLILMVSSLQTTSAMYIQTSIFQDLDQSETKRAYLGENYGEFIESDYDVWNFTTTDSQWYKMEFETDAYLSKWMHIEDNNGEFLNGSEDSYDTSVVSIKGNGRDVVIHLHIDFASTNYTLTISEIDPPDTLSHFSYSPNISEGDTFMWNVSHYVNGNPVNNGDGSLFNHGENITIEFHENGSDINIGVNPNSPHPQDFSSISVKRNGQEYTHYQGKGIYILWLILPHTYYMFNGSMLGMIEGLDIYIYNYLIDDIQVIDDLIFTEAQTDTGNDTKYFDSVTGALLERNFTDTDSHLMIQRTDIQYDIPDLDESPPSNETSEDGSDNSPEDSPTADLAFNSFLYGFLLIFTILTRFRKKMFLK